MSTVRIAVASTPLTTNLADAVPAAIAAVEEAGRQGARIVCLPETGLPGHRGQTRELAEVSAAELEAAIREVGEAARRAGVVTIVGAERPTARGREILSVVLGADGERLGEQVKTQVAPSEEHHYVPGAGRRVFTAAGLTFGIAICHEAFRYPEIARSLVLAGARVLFVPHYVTTDDGSLPVTWCASENPYNEKAVLCRALENTVYVAAANITGSDQGSLTAILSPEGQLLASVDYGRVGVAVADLDLELSTAALALRFAPGRSLVG